MRSDKPMLNRTTAARVLIRLRPQCDHSAKHVVIEYVKFSILINIGEEFTQIFDPGPRLWSELLWKREIERVLGRWSAGTQRKFGREDAWI